MLIGGAAGYKYSRWFCCRCNSCVNRPGGKFWHTCQFGCGSCRGASRMGNNITGEVGASINSCYSTLCLNLLLLSSSLAGRGGFTKYNRFGWNPRRSHSICTTCPCSSRTQRSDWSTTTAAVHSFVTSTNEFYKIISFSSRCESYASWSY